MKAGRWDSYRATALKAAHPDTGGDGETFARVKAAIDMIEASR